MINDTKTELLTDLSLNYLVKEPGKTGEKKKAVILLHGVGSNEEDLFRLAAQLPEDFFVISPRGPFTLGTGRYAWYQVDFSTGKPVINKEQEAQSREIILQFIAEIRRKYNMEEIYIGGFSQGAIMGYSTGLLHPDAVKGVVGLSGRILEEIRPLVRTTAGLERLNVFVAHGISDSTLPVHYARNAKEYLESLGVRVSYHEYNMGHQIAPSLLKDLVNWMK